MTFSEHLFQLRKARNLTQKEVAEGTGISWRGYQNYELGLREPSLSTIVALADFFNISLDALVCRTRIRVVTLMENSAKGDLCAAHGLSLYIETPKHKILFDMGPDDGFVKNAEALGVDLSAVDIAILSHGHWDHGGGIAAFFAVNSTAKVYIREDAFEGYFHVEEDMEKYIGIDAALKTSDRIVLTGESCRIDEELLLFADVPRDFDTAGASGRLFRRTAEGLQLDRFTHEQDLLLTVEGKAVLVAGCAHRGIVNIINGAKARLGRAPDATFGGFHLFQLTENDPASDAVIDLTAKTLLAGDTVYHTGHCTGEYAYERLKAVLGDRLQSIPSGSVYEI